MILLLILVAVLWGVGFCCTLWGIRLLRAITGGWFFLVPGQALIDILFASVWPVSLPVWILFNGRG